MDTSEKLPIRICRWICRRFRAWWLALCTLPECVSCKRMVAGKGIFLCRNCRLRYMTERAKSCSDFGFPHALCACSIQAANDVYRIMHMVPYDPQNYGVASRVVFVAKDDFDADNFAFIADQLGAVLELNGITPDHDWFVTWIPRRSRTIRRIGHDQSKMIAKIFARNHRLKLIRLFVNTGDKPQKMQNFDGRVQNAYSSYRVTKLGARRIKDRTVIIIDDLVTTGATFHVTITLAMEAGAKAVVPITFAKTDRGVKRFKMQRNRR